MKNTDRPNAILQITRRGGKTHVTAPLSGFYYIENDLWVSYCRELDFATCAESAEKVHEAMREAIGLWFESCIHRGTLEQALTELGWVCIESRRLEPCDASLLPTATPPAFVIDSIRATRSGPWSSRVSF
jgi:predicted RNase H-like HicB family nuclease